MSRNPDNRTLITLKDGTPVDNDNPLPVTGTVGGGPAGSVGIKNVSDTRINPATEEKQDSIITAIGAIPGGGGVQYTEGDVDATITGTAILIEDTGNTLRVAQGDVANGVDVDVTRVSGNVTVVQSTGTNLKVDASGTVVHIDDNAGSITVDGPLTDTQLRATAVPVSAASLPLPSGAATAALQTQPGVDIGDVTVNNGAGVNAVNIQDGGNSITVDGTVTANAGSGPWPVTDNSGSLTVDGTVTVTQGTGTNLHTVVDSGSVTANAGTNLNTSLLALDATLTNGTQKSISRGGAKGTTTAADVTSTAEGANNQALDVQIYHGGAAKDPTAIRSLTSADTVTVVQTTGTNLHSVIDSGTISTITNVVHVDDNGGSITVDGTVTITPSGTQTVDTELPNASALSDAMSNPTTPMIGSAITVFNGTTWDRARGDITNGLDVDVTRVSGNVTVVQSTATNLKVDASGVAVPITDNSGSITVDQPTGTNLHTVVDSGTITTVSTVTSISNVVHVDDNASTLSIDDGGGSITVDGSVTGDRNTTGSYGAKTISTVPAQILSSDATRDAWAIVNNGPDTLFVGQDSSVSTSGSTMGIMIFPGGSISSEGDGNWSGAVYGIYASQSDAPNVSYFTSGGGP